MDTTVINKAQKTSTYSSEDEPLYQAQQKIYPQGVSSRFRTIKWAVLLVTLGIYYLLPFVRWDRGINAPSQAVLVDFPSRRFYFFFIEIWPQEVYYFTGLLIFAALFLFLMNAVAGRVWCGYLCPQTVWTDLYLLIERWVEGDRRERILADTAPWSFTTVALKAQKHFLWLVIAWWTGGAWVLYFADAPTLVWQLATFQAPAIAWISIAILTFTTYTLAGYLREQVCTYMCPWPRIQAALIDEYSLNVTYRYDRGEPRFSFKKGEALRAKGLPAGDCIDCGQCIAVCPTGVDIRQGLQLSCIQCGLCIDACDNVMQKIGRTMGLIAYDTDLNIRRRLEQKSEISRIMRPRTLLYTALLTIVGALMLGTLATRSHVGINVIHDRNPIFVRLSDGSIRNAITIRILNKELQTRIFKLEVMGLPRLAGIDIVGTAADESGRLLINIGPDQTRELRLLITVQDTLPPKASIPLVIRVTDVKTNEAAEAHDHFLGP